MSEVVRRPRHSLICRFGGVCAQVLQRGRVVERGTHAQLVQRGGEYAQLWAMQAAAVEETLAEEASTEPAR